MEKYIINLFSNDNTGFLKNPIESLSKKKTATKTATKISTKTATKKETKKEPKKKTTKKETKKKATKIAIQKNSNHPVKELTINQVAGGESVNNGHCSSAPTQCVDSYASCSQTGGR